MDLRLTEKQIWLEIWGELYGSDDDHHLIDHIRNKFVDFGWMNSDAKVERFEEAVHIVMAKIWKNVPRKVREDALQGRR